MRTEQLTFPPRRSPGPLAEPHPPGISLFVRGSGIALYQDGRVLDIRLPYPVHGLAHLADDGSRASALLRDAAGQRTYVWSRDLRTGVESIASAQLPFVRPVDGGILWSRDARRLLVQPSEGDGPGDVFILELDGKSQRRGVQGERIHWYDWRDTEEATIVSSPQPIGTTPLGPVTFWSWTRDTGLEKILVANAHSAFASWSPDGSRLAMVGLDPNGRSPIVQLAQAPPRGPAGPPRTLLQVSALADRPEGCPYLRGEVALSLPHWSLDGLTLAVAGRVLPQSSFFVAFVTRDGALRSIFRSPNSCYIALPRWSQDDLFIALFGPDCGPTTLVNRVALVKPDGAVTAELSIPRKGGAFPSPDGRWLVSVGLGEVWYIPTADPAARIVVPLDGFVSWCCAQR